VYAVSNDTAATNYGVFARGAEYGVYAEQSGAGGIAVFQGFALGTADLIQLWVPNNLRFKVTNAGNVQADGSYTTPAGDVAERVDAIEPVEASDVVEIDPEAEDRFRLSRAARSPLVAGVISTEPGVLLNDRTLGEDERDARPALALAGRVPVKASTKTVQSVQVTSWSRLPHPDTRCGPTPCRRRAR